MNNTTAITATARPAHPAPLPPGVTLADVKRHYRGGRRRYPRPLNDEQAQAVFVDVLVDFVEEYDRALAAATAEVAGRNALVDSITQDLGARGMLSLDATSAADLLDARAMAQEASHGN